MSLLFPLTASNDSSVVSVSPESSYDSTFIYQLQYSYRFLYLI